MFAPLVRFLFGWTDEEPPPPPPVEPQGVGGGAQVGYAFSYKPLVKRKRWVATSKLSNNDVMYSMKAVGSFSKQQRNPIYGKIASDNKNKVVIRPVIGTFLAAKSNISFVKKDKIASKVVRKEEKIIASKLSVEKRLHGSAPIQVRVSSSLSSRILWWRTRNNIISNLDRKPYKLKILKDFIDAL